MMKMKRMIGVEFEMKQNAVGTVRQVNKNGSCCIMDSKNIRLVNEFYRIVYMI